MAGHCLMQSKYCDPQGTLHDSSPPRMRQDYRKIYQLHVNRLERVGFISAR